MWVMHHFEQMPTRRRFVQTGLTSNRINDAKSLSFLKTKTFILSKKVMKLSRSSVFQAVDTSSFYSSILHTPLLPLFMSISEILSVLRLTGENYQRL